eukprot:TRINITY_DN12898_c0_g1_i1.p1 TRINITY_DN12898_c0_g1~~TRINITY_DN12898_c0_g1_i1.p1  ORF type:complete len:804 (-),score=241.98 TRINITY_DN12898_c0_g1_i1:32-2443(-)
MSVVGVDIGTLKSVLAIVGKGGIDTVTNSLSGRKTASQVGFDQNQRCLGETAKQNWKRNFRKTIGQPKRLLGKDFEDLEVERDFAGACKFTKGENNDIHANLFFKGENYDLSMEQIVAMLLTHIKEIAEDFTGLPAADIVLTVPGYWDDKRRRALLAAAGIAGLNVIRLITDNTAVAINYQYLNRKNMGPDEKRKVLIVDVGGADTSVGIYEFSKEGFKTLARGYDEFLGGRDIDHALADFFASRFQAKTGQNIKDIPKSWMRLLATCEGIKKNLNLGGASSGISEVCIYEDFDMNDTITREEYLELLAPLTARLQEVVSSTLLSAGLTSEDLFGVEWVGGCMRVEAFQRAVSEALGRPCENHMNAEEAASHGAALQAAYISPRIQLRNQFSIAEVQDDGILVSWNSLNSSEPDQTLALVKTRGKASYKAKQLTLKRPAEPMHLTLRYESGSTIARYVLPEVPHISDKDLQDIIVKFKYDHNFITTLEKVDHVDKVEIEYQEEVKPEVEEKKEGSTEEKTESTENTDVEMTDSQPEEKKYVTKTKVEKKTTPIPFYLETPVRITEEQMKVFIEQEKAFREGDRYHANVEKTKNDLESYVYNSRSALHQNWSEFVTPEEMTPFSNSLYGTESWLYDEGMHQPLEVYQNKLAELKSLGEKYALRYNESLTRDEAIATFHSIVQKYKDLALSGKPEYAHIENINDITAECDRVSSLMEEKFNLQASLSKTDDPVVLTSDIIERTNNLASYCERILATPVPKVEEKKEETKENTSEASQESKTEGETPQESADQMDVDQKNEAMETD